MNREHGILNIFPCCILQYQKYIFFRRKMNGSHFVRCIHPAHFILCHSQIDKKRGCGADVYFSIIASLYMTVIFAIIARKCQDK